MCLLNTQPFRENSLLYLNVKSCKNTLWDLIFSAAGDLVRDSKVAYACLPDFLSFSLSWVMVPRFPWGIASLPTSVCWLFTAVNQSAQANPGRGVGT